MIQRVHAWRQRRRERAAKRELVRELEAKRFADLEAKQHRREAEINAAVSATQQLGLALPQVNAAVETLKRAGVKSSAVHAAMRAAADPPRNRAERRAIKHGRRR